MRLEKNQIAAVLFIAAVKEMVKPHLKQIGRTGVTGDVSAELSVGSVCSCHHRQGVPAHQRGNFFFDGQIARKGRLNIHGNGVDIRRDQLRRPVQLVLVCQRHQLVQQKTRSLSAMLQHNRIESIAPLRSLLWIGICVVRGVGRVEKLFIHGIQYSEKAAK